MELGQKLKQARLEAGLSQRQLCADTITRNMISQIENGSAQPSMQTLCILAERLGRSVGWFLESETATGPRQQLSQARSLYQQGAFGDARKLLAQMQATSELDPERYLLEAMCCMAMAQQAAEDKRPGYAGELLEQAAKAGSQTVYYGPELEQKRLLMLFDLFPHRAKQLAVALRPDPRLSLLLAAAQEDPVRMGAILDALPSDAPGWHKLRADAWYAQDDFARAVTHYEKAEPTKEVWQRLEVCFRELKDFEGAYRCACKLRDER